MKYSKECLSCFNMEHHERHDVYFRYNKKKENITVINQYNNNYNSFSPNDIGRKI